ncbi:MAG TPA: MMPL family transporter [Thermoplasmata archaeon]|nr:MMPL family transporter [Thermoplasmata archaeon]
MRRSSQEGYAVFRFIGNVVTRRYKLLVLLWILVFAGAIVANQVWRVGDVTSFDQSAILPKDTESSRAQTILNEEFGEQGANDSATIVLSANDTTSEFYRWFVLDLNDAIVRSASLPAGGNATLALHWGGNLTLDRQVKYLDDATNATIYGVYEDFAYRLASQLNGPVHEQVLLAQSAVGIYWGVPGTFLASWATHFGPEANATAYNDTYAFVNATFPSAATHWAAGWLQAFYPAWKASFLNGSLAAFGPRDRADAVIRDTLPSFLASPLVQGMFPAEAIDFQSTLIPRFSLGNFTDTARVRDAGLSVFLSAGVAKLPFFQDLVENVNESAAEANLRAFARMEVLGYDLNATPLLLPFNVTRFYVSPDRRIMLMNYAFTREEGFRDTDGGQPVAEDVLVFRELVSRLKAAYGARADVYVTGSAPSSLDNEQTFGGSEEFIVTIVLVIVLIGLYFRSAVGPALPIVTIGIAIMVANLFVYFVATHLFAIDFTVTAVLQTVLLAVGTDYSIFIVSRYRDERQDGKDRADAVRNSVIWAGESVATSGGAVLISFAALSVGSFPLVRTMGLTLGFAVTAALALALTFIPALVLILGNSVFWPSTKKVTKKRLKDPAHWTRTERYFHRAATTSMEHAKLVVLVAVLLTVPATYIVITDQPTYDFTAGAPSTDSSRGLDAISGSFGYGFIFPSYVLVRFGDPVLLSNGSFSVAHLDAIHELSTRLPAKEPGIKSTEGPTNPQGIEVDYRNLPSMPEEQRSAILLAMTPYVGSDAQTVRLLLVFSDPPFSKAALDTVDRLRPEIAEIKASVSGLQAASIYLGGVSPVLNDVRHNMDHDLQVMAVIVITGLFIVLLFVLGSVLIPVRAILTILLSIAWTMALTIVLFHAWKDLDLIFILPLALFVMAMGLGMDYDIFIITRVREEVAKGKPDPEAIAEATTRTGGIISACGIVMAGAFATLMLNPSPFLQQIGFALAFAILLDSMVVRIYLVPAIMVLAGKSNWWAPGPLQRVHREAKDAKAAKAPKPEPARDP